MLALTVTLVASVAVAEFPVQDPDDPEVFPVTLPVRFPVTLPVRSPVKSPTKLVAVNAPDDELKVRFVPVFGGKLPVAAVVNKTLQVVSDDSSATVTLVAIAEVPVKLVADKTCVPATFNTFPEARSRCSELVQESVESTQLNVLSDAPLRVNPPPSAVVSDGVETFPRVIFLSSISKFVVSIVVVVPETVRSPGIVTKPAELIVKRPTPPVLRVNVSDPPLIPVFVSELKLKAGAEALPSGALLNKSA